MRLRFSESEIIKTTVGDHDIFSNEDITANAGMYIHESCDGEIIYGDNPKEAPPAAKYFVKGWWTDKHDKPIKEARILDTVKFHIQTQGIDDPKGKKIEIKLFEYDTSVYLSLGTYGSGAVETRPFDDHVRIVSGKNEITELTLDENGKTAITINLTWGMHEMFNETFFGGFAEMGLLEFYFECSYGEDRGIWLPASFGDYLKVTISNKKLFIQPACPGYHFPEIRSSNGEIVVFNEEIIEIKEELDGLQFALKELQPVYDHVKDKIKDKIKDGIGAGTDKLRRAIAVRQLRQGKLVTNIGSIHQRKKIYTYKDFNNLGEEIEIQRASHMAWQSNGKKITTKGISQLDYFENEGMYNGVLKATKELLHVFDFVDLINFMTGKGRPDAISTPFPAIDLITQFVTGPVIAQMKELDKEITLDILEKCKNMGIKGIREFISLNANPDYNPNNEIKGNLPKTYNIMEINQNIYNELMKGEVNTLNDLRKLVIGEGSSLEEESNIIILWKWHWDEVINDDLVTIETIFFPY